MGTTGRKRSLGAQGWSEGKAESEKAKEKKRRNKTIRVKERGSEKSKEAFDGREREKAMCYTTGRIEAIPRWQRIEKRSETREGEREREREREN